TSVRPGRGSLRAIRTSGANRVPFRGARGRGARRLPAPDDSPVFSGLVDSVPFESTPWSLDAERWRKTDEGTRPWDLGGAQGQDRPHRRIPLRTPRRPFLSPGSAPDPRPPDLRVQPLWPRRARGVRHGTGGIDGRAGGGGR